MSHQVLVIGNSTVDHVFIVPQMPARDEKADARTYRAYSGGQAANAAVTMALLGLRVRFIGTFGDDTAAAMSRAEFKRLAVDLSDSTVVTHCTHPTAAVVVDEALNLRTIVMHRDPRLSLDHVDVDPAIVAASDAVYTDGHEGMASVRLAKLAQRVSTPVVADMERVTEYSEPLLRLTTHLVAPAALFQELTGCEDLAHAMAVTLEMGPSAVVATLGKDGSVGLERWMRQPVYVAASPVQVVDTTGAGDAYHAAYIVGLLGGGDLRQRLGLASRIAALKCSVAGPRLTAEALRGYAIGSGSAWPSTPMSIEGGLA